MDVGYFLGGDLQHLIFDSAPSENMYGVDIVSHWDVGYSLFKDKDKVHFKGHFIEADILSTDKLELLALRSVDIICLGGAAPAVVEGPS
jgi:hypothetical protein